MQAKIYFNVEQPDGVRFVADVWTLDELEHMGGVWMTFPSMVKQIKKSISELYPNCLVCAESRPANR